MGGRQRERVTEQERECRGNGEEGKERGREEGKIKKESN